jgi:PAS domain S-box-containing protein
MGDLPVDSAYQDELEIRIHQQAAVASFGQQALGDASLQELMDEAVRIVVDGLRVPFCEVLELLPGGEQLLLRSGKGWKSGYVGSARIGTGGESQAGFALLREEAVIVEDLASETRFVGSPLLWEHGIMSGISTVIRGAESPFGVLGAHSSKPRAFNPHDVDFLQAIANILAESVIRSEVEEGQRRLAAIVASSDDAILSKDHNAIITSWNQAAERLYGYSAEEAIGRPVGIIVPTDRKGEEITILNVIWGGGHVDHYESQRVAKDGSILHVSISASPIHNKRGEVTGVSVIARDISERRRLEELERDLDKRDFVQAVAHELRNPLSALTGLAAAMSSNWERMTEEQRRECLVGIGRSGGRAQLLINDLLDLSHVQSPNFRVQMETVSLKSSIEEALASSPPPSDKSVSVDADPDAMVRADPHRLEQVLVNLLTNAYKYGGRNVRVRCRHRLATFEVAVEDDGLGVPEELEKSLFDPFTRAPEGKIGGSGLGLSIARGLVRAFGGDLYYERLEPHGARFVMTLVPGSS